jgi:hypothetical protein
MPQQRKPARDQRPGAGNRRPPRSASRRKRERRLQAQRHRATGAPRRLRLWLSGGAGALVVVAVVLAVVLTRGHGTSGSATPSPAPTPTPPPLASLETAESGVAPVDGVSCDATPSTSNRSFAHLAIYVNGSPRQVPAGIGVGTPRTTQPTDAGPFVSGPCYYWLNTRTGDGVLHVQPPAAATYTLGTFFDIWGQTLSATQLGPASGAVTVLVNGSQYSGDPRSVQLTEHAVIQINVGSAVPFQKFTFPAGE